MLLPVGCASRHRRGPTLHRPARLLTPGRQRAAGDAWRAMRGGRCVVRGAWCVGGSCVARCVLPLTRCPVAPSPIVPSIVPPLQRYLRHRDPAESRDGVERRQAAFYFRRTADAACTMAAWGLTTTRCCKTDGTSRLVSPGPFISPRPAHDSPALGGVSKFRNLPPLPRRRVVQREIPTTWIEDCAGSGTKPGIADVRHASHPPPPPAARRPIVPGARATRRLVICRAQNDFMRTRMRQRRTTDGQCGSLGRSRYGRYIKKKNLNVSAHPASLAFLLPPLPRSPADDQFDLARHSSFGAGGFTVSPSSGNIIQIHFVPEMYLGTTAAFCGLRRQPAPPGCRPFPLKTGARQIKVHEQAITRARPAGVGCEI